ncbi:MAG: universal stress protein [Candidatus Methanomethyliaceae archaeon]|nr:universal stress protein [Candidatus Methanomethyliaceae archaeon]
MRENWIKAVLVGIDGSKYAEYAFEFAIDLARRYSAKLFIVYIHALPSMPLVTGVPAYPHIITHFPNYYPKVPPDVKEKIEPLLKKYEQIAREYEIKEIESRIVSFWGTVGEGLVYFADEKKVSVIVIGSRGLTGLKRVLLGSVADYVIRNAHCNVIVIRST